jgi:NAD(P)-dependent dehydrogenase (short-subunit alcohol dehydrogenase family)
MLTACLEQELSDAGIRVMAVHPGRLKTEVRAPDADTDPQEAARVLADWIENVDEQQLGGLYDLMGQEYIEW